jgi:hypothetical protein
MLKFILPHLCELSFFFKLVKFHQKEKLKINHSKMNYFWKVFITIKIAKFLYVIFNA